MGAFDGQHAGEIDAFFPALDVLIEKDKSATEPMYVKSDFAFVRKGDPACKSIADLVKGTQKGILVTRTWYIRMVDPQTVLLTGLTRDGTFYIENGQIKHPLKNFRFNESPVIMLNNIEELGKPVRVAGDESSFVMMIPPMKLRDFTFTSLSDAV